MSGQTLSLLWFCVIHLNCGDSGAHINTVRIRFIFPLFMFFLQLDIGIVSSLVIFFEVRCIIVGILHVGNEKCCACVLYVGNGERCIGIWKV